MGTALTTKNIDCGDVHVELNNFSSWLDLTPVVRIRPISAHGSEIRVSLDGADVTNAMLGSGVVFNGNRRLQPGESRQFTLHQNRNGAEPGSATWALELLPHPSDPSLINQTLIVHVK